jgi:hypothetical protein
MILKLVFHLPCFYSECFQAHRKIERTVEWVFVFLITNICTYTVLFKCVVFLLNYLELTLQIS